MLLFTVANLVDFHGNIKLYFKYNLFLRNRIVIFIQSIYFYISTFQQSFMKKDL